MNDDAAPRINVVRVEDKVQRMGDIGDRLGRLAVKETEQIIPPPLTAENDRPPSRGP